MATLYLTQQGATLRKDHRRFVIELAGIVILEIHEFKVDRIAVFGNVQITTQTIAYLLAQGIDVAFISMSGHLKGRLAPLATKNIPLRVRQYELTRDADFALRIAKAMIAGKIANCAALLARYQRNHPEADFAKSIQSLGNLELEVARKQGVDSLRGVEGHAAAIYFQAFAQMMRTELVFAGRNRRPPTDPINAMLSFGYMILYNEAISALVTIGFEPYLGFLHGINYGRCSLALDIMEEFRHLTIDRLVLSIVNLSILTLADFTITEGGVYLSDEARKRFLKEYESLMTKEFQHGRTHEITSFRRALYDQALKLQQTLMRNIPYQAFRGWH